MALFLEVKQFDAVPQILRSVSFSEEPEFSGPHLATQGGGIARYTGDFMSSSPDLVFKSRAHQTAFAGTLRASVASPRSTPESEPSGKFALSRPDGSTGRDLAARRSVIQNARLNSQLQLIFCMLAPGPRPSPAPPCHPLTSSAREFRAVHAAPGRRCWVFVG